MNLGWDIELSRVSTFIAVLNFDDMWLLTLINILCEKNNL